MLAVVDGERLLTRVFSVSLDAGLESHQVPTWVS
jgi:hypothetical protein